MLVTRIRRRNLIATLAILITIAIGHATRHDIYRDEVYISLRRRFPIPTGRHIAAILGLSGFSPLIGGLAEAPIVKWSVDLGGSLTNSEQAQLVDVNGDGREELLRVTTDRIICQTVGRRPAVADARTSQPQHRVPDSRLRGRRNPWPADRGRHRRRTAARHREWQVRESRLLYPCRDVFGRYERVGKILADVPGEQICAPGGAEIQLRNSVTLECAAPGSCGASKTAWSLPI